MRELVQFITTKNCGPAGSNKNAKLTVLFEEWSASSEDWTKSEMLVRYKTSRLHRRKGSRTWMTQPEISRKYNNPQMAADIVRNKLESEHLAKTQVRWHPDLPGQLEHRQYLVYDYDAEITVDDEVLEGLFEVGEGGNHDDLDDRDNEKNSKDKGKKRGRSPAKKKHTDKKSKKKKGKKSSSSSSSSSSSFSSSSKSSRNSTKTKKPKKEKPEKPDPEKPELTKAQQKALEKAAEKERKRQEKEEEKRQKEQEKAQEREKKKVEKDAQREVQKQKDKKISLAKKDHIDV